MLKTPVLAALLAFTAYPTVLSACGLSPNRRLSELTESEKLRRAGPAGLQKALAAYDEASDALRKIYQQMMFSCAGPDAMKDSHDKAESSLATARALVDQVAAQRGAAVSRLFWYTDMNEAKKAAAEAGKPILSLRMLGKLSEELSCANSRFFRTALYSNKEISDFLRDHYVLHWQSVRPVPQITIDFGDGRRLERTVTGNSAHYVLDSNGRPLDVLPGLYGPQAYLDWLKRSSDVHARLQSVASSERDMWLTTYHRQRLAAVNEALHSDLATAAPSQEAIASKDDAFWQSIAALHANEVKLDDASVAVVKSENPLDPRTAGALSAAKRRVEDPLLRVVRNFQQAMAMDTVKNEYTLHRQIHDWFIAGEAPQDVDALNERVYAELFLTPPSDPWLGLAPADAYTGLTGSGLTVDAPPQAAAN